LRTLSFLGVSEKEQASAFQELFPTDYPAGFLPAISSTGGVSANAEGGGGGGSHSGDGASDAVTGGSERSDPEMPETPKSAPSMPDSS